MPVRIAAGLAVSAIALAIAGRRFFYLFRLIAAGRPDRGRFRHVGGRIWAELVEVGGQKKLLRRPVAGLAHAFTFWGFTILFLTIIESFGDLFSKNFSIPGIGTSPVLGFIEDF
ncbi:MAG: Fe-S oxidoreductase, partial [Acidimicrobiales bacterium]